ncbi:Rieske (2Fe-2S) protein [Algoriphagus pacificus]|uniref:Rieske (2Fe-2S) protein n=1 Tax=Algoriphagus pacificus TaxID=2811234 RepID=A0ABS3CCD7_9BACT|nr:Rieske (2Fe-2S) protein [Algoriphagus pacificus]MBN7814728.1 Rieske (2Fe-2S) protein [Algoriphagus pacificus]
MKKFTLGNSRENILEIIPERTLKKVLVGDKSIGLLRIENRFHAFQSSCPHKGASLLEGSINQLEEIICPLHQYRFDLKTGSVRAGYCSDLEIYSTELTNKGLIILLP